MNGNYGWQKQQAQEHLQARRLEAQRHRMAQQDDEDRDPMLSKGNLAILLFVAFVVVGFFLSA